MRNRRMMNWGGGVMSAAAAVVWVAMGAWLTTGEARGKTEVGVGVGFAVGDYGVGTATSLGLSYGRRSRGGDSWRVSLGVGSPGYYYHRAPACTWYAWHPDGYWPGYPYGSSSWSVRYSRHGRQGDHRSHWGVSYRYSSGPHGWRSYRPHGSYYYGYAPYGYGAYYGPYWTGSGDGTRVVVGGTYRWHGDSDVAVGLAVPIVIGGGKASRPSLSERIVRGGPVEQNPIMKRVWVAGQYETRPAEKGTGEESGAKSGGGSGERVWVPGHWEYLPDTF